MVATRWPEDDAGMNNENQLLAGLQADEQARCLPHLQRVDLRAGQVICEPGGVPSFAMFPITAIVSLMYITHDGGSAEVAVVGHEGVVGLPLFMGGNDAAGAAPGQAVVQSSGSAWRLNAHVLRAEVNRAGPALHLLLKYTQSLMGQVAQTALCNRHHSIDQQLSRRLLMGLDRSDSDDLVMTHEAAAQMLGVRREGVTTAALKLQDAGVIRYRRGHIRVLDRARLEQRTCGCYVKVKTAHARPASKLPWPVQMPQPMRPSHMVFA
jgi:CRP-like cAMP-binding protein